VKIEAGCIGGEENKKDRNAFDLTLKRRKARESDKEKA